MPCNYPSNSYSNKRWCCGDEFHMDVSVWVFEKLASTNVGVVGMRYRETSCSSQVWTKPAPETVSYGPELWNWVTWEDWHKYVDPRSNLAQCSGVTPQTQLGSTIQTGNTSIPQAQLPQTGTGNTSTPQAQLTQTGSGAINIYMGGFQSGWFDASYSGSPWDTASSYGLYGSLAKCSTLYQNGAIAFGGPDGTFSGMTSMEFWVQENSGSTPNISLQLSSPMGNCNTVQLQSLWQSVTEGNWIKYNIYLGNFVWGGAVVAQAAQFTGCSKGIDSYHINKIIFLNNANWNQPLCVDKVKLM